MWLNISSADGDAVSSDSTPSAHVNGVIHQSYSFAPKRPLASVGVDILASEMDPEILIQLRTSRVRNYKLTISNATSVLGSSEAPLRNNLARDQ
jgi:hypothetical protein